ncbi:NUDIX domain-containing protein [Flavobacterium ardleyense]|uniref:NUDIX domain-containing protein n=1 Tax=Flavobacterium ardleyense TaxID=2038737 RepID=A0ABW5ZA46_9FLAO
MLISSGLAIFINDKILLVKPKGLEEGFYSIPKGLVEKNESILDAAIRETYEETGVLISETQIDKTPHICNYLSNTGKITKRVYYFVVKIESSELIKTGKIDFSEIDNYDLYDRQKAEKVIYWKMLSILNHLSPSKFSPKELLLLEQLKIVKKVKHPVYPIFLYNYTDKCKQFHFWNDTTLWCRGLVLDTNGNIIARPFKKFFEEHQLYDEFKPSQYKAKIYEKIDGALGIMFFYKGKLIFCNRQSFKSRQAVVASEIFYKKHAKQLDTLTQHNRTYLFEIVYPNNRFVVNYGIEEDLYLLGIMENSTGRKSKEQTSFKTPQLKTKNAIFDKKNEGSVIHFEDDFKLKIKTDSFKKRYLEIEQIKTNISKNTTYLKNNANRENWNVDYNKLYNIFLRKYLLLYLQYYKEDNNSEQKNIKKITFRKVFPG